MSKNLVHTTACGVEPYDKNWAEGASKDPESGGFSPYQRINDIRKLYKEAPEYLTALRAKIWADVYKEYESQPIILKKAYAMAKYMEVCPLSYHEGELMLIDDGADIFHGHVYPEYACDWVYNDLKYHPMYERKFNILHYDEKTKDDILETEDYWKGKSIREVFIKRLPDDVAKGVNVAGGMLLFNPSINVNFGVGHNTANYPYALKRGLKGIKEDIRAAKEKLGAPINLEKIRAHQFYDAELIVFEAISNYFRRYAAFAKEKINEYSSQQTKDELLRMSEICEKLSEEPPTDFWEATQLVTALHQITFIENNGRAVSLGRMDQYMYPYYKYSLDNGIYTKDFMQELIEFSFLQQTSLGQAAEEAGELWRGGIKGYASGVALIVGGVDKDGNDATNDLSFMYLDAVAHTRLDSPWLTVRNHKGTPYELKVKTVEVMKCGTGHPKILNDETCIAAMMRHGVSEEDAWDYVNIGCVEVEIPGKTWGWHDITGLNTPKVLELALNNGGCLNCRGDKCGNYRRCKGAGKTLGLETGYLRDFKTFDEVKAAFEAQLKYWTDRMDAMIELLQDVHTELDDYPFTSALVEGCTESGKSLHQGGAKYNFTGVQVLGTATVSDSLSVLKQLVYEDKKVTAEEFHDALLKNWEGHERLYQLVNGEKAHHFGNDDDYADDMVQYVYNTYTDMIQAYPPTRNNGTKGIIKTGAFSQIVNLIFGMAVGATPDGRKAHESIAENIGAARTAHSSRDRNGPTAYAKSIGKFDHSKCGGGTLINFKFGSESVAGEQGRDNLVDFIDAYFEANPQHVQVMIANRDVLIEAQKKPEEYSDLLVRVSGFSSYFTSLGTNFQNELINRTEHSM